jgi:hypothetical protein
MQPSQQHSLVECNLYIHTTPTSQRERQKERKKRTPVSHTDIDTDGEGSTYRSKLGLCGARMHAACMCMFMCGYGCVQGARRGGGRATDRRRGPSSCCRGPVSTTHMHTHIHACMSKTRGPTTVRSRDPRALRSTAMALKPARASLSAVVVHEWRVWPPRHTERERGGSVPGHVTSALSALSLTHLHATE